MFYFIDVEGGERNLLEKREEREMVWLAMF
jgi:hypothetical protein